MNDVWPVGQQRGVEGHFDSSSSSLPLTKPSIEAPNTPIQPWQPKFPRKAIKSWKWSGSRPSGEVAEVTEGDVSITSNRGNEITRHGKPGDPAVHIARSGNDVVKNAHELSVEEKANGSSETAKGGSESKDQDAKEKDKEESNGNGTSKAGEKHERDGVSEKNGVKEQNSDVEMDEDDDDGENDDPKAKGPVTKKQKTTKKDSGSKEDGIENGDAKGKRGRPKKGDQTKAPAQKKQPKSAATEDGKPRRSTRLAT